MIEFIEENHIYLNDGIIIPSVSDLVAFATGDDYSKIPSYILKKAQDFGTHVHEAIEKYLTKKEYSIFSDPYEEQAFKQFLKYEDRIKEPICEQMVDYQGRYAGRYDCLSNGYLIDYKTNSKLNIPHLQYQMGFYKLALEEKGIKVDECICIWLPKRKSGQWVKIRPKSKEECLEVLEKYENQRHNENTRAFAETI